ncbi:hypothetical protein BS47DRAFT_1305675 [Hydnum rufescens UP504]|uniref:Uncharacterized protein n=1 Tax=Hydnum rufescens UP504 TaxID=1448309 RepID=A0A9P6DPY9_9AGAM|nr:hypothetical protein BS47DRAFT_1305675 [Hydnum rufescens UP504]
MSIPKKHLWKSGGADKKGRDRVASYIDRPGEMAGSVLWVCYWKAVGHPNSDVVPSGDQLRSAEHYKNSQNVIANIDVLNRSATSALKFFAPDSYKGHTKLIDTIHSNPQYKWAEAMAVNDHCVLSRRGISFNRQTPQHTDPLVPPGEWTLISSVGQHTVGGDFVLPTLGVVIPFLPPTHIWTRGGEAEHYIRPFSGGQRISITHFTHSTVWDHFGIPFPWSTPYDDSKHRLMELIEQMKARATADGKDKETSHIARADLEKKKEERKRKQSFQGSRSNPLM